jgi:hypothetical protein
MNRMRRFASAVSLVLFVLSLNGFAQTPSPEVTAGADATQFSAEGPAQSLRLQVFSPAEEFGDLLGIDLRGLTPAESNMNSSQASVAGPEASYKDLSLNGVKVRELVFKNQFGRKGFNWFILFMPSY